MITEGSPPPPILTEPPVPSIKKFSNNFRCNFDTAAGVYGMTKDTLYEINLKLRRGPTLTSGTGPSSDHKTGRGKQSIFLELRQLKNELKNCGTLFELTIV